MQRSPAGSTLPIGRSTVPQSGVRPQAWLEVSAGTDACTVNRRAPIPEDITICSTRLPVIT